MLGLLAACTLIFSTIYPDSLIALLTCLASCLSTVTRRTVERRKLLRWDLAGDSILNWRPGIPMTQ
jgi:hypothetical protein